MQEPEASPERITTALERDGAWLLRLARALTRDAEAASDAVQTTLLRAWERTRRGTDAAAGGRPPRAWLARVVRNALSAEARRADLRRAREEASARAEGIAAESTALERIELQRRVMDALEALPEPYRATLVARFLDGLSPRAIAGREGLPVKTVHTRIERGLARLRTHLDARFGDDRGAWVGALLALPRPGIAWHELGRSSIWKGMAMGTGAKALGGVVAVAMVGAILWLRTGRGEASERRNEAPAPVAPAVLVERADDPAPVPGPTRTLAEPEPAAPASTAAAPAAPAAETVLLRGRVLDARGTALAGLWVQARAASRLDERPRPRARTAADGGFSVSLARADLPLRLTLDDTRYALLREAFCRPANATREHLLVAVEATDLTGIVVDESGAPVEGASVSLRPDAALLVDFPYALDNTVRVDWRIETDPDGRFRLERVPAVPGGELRADKRGYGPGTLALEVPPSGELRLVLRTLTGDERVPEVEGLVLLPGGGAAVGATVRYGMHTTRTDGTGRFHLPLDDSPDPDLELAAGLEGYGTALIEGYGALQERSQPYAPAPVVLVLRESNLELAGKVVDARGAPLVGWQVQLAEGTPVTRRRMPPILAEELDGRPVSCLSADDGSFVLHGLLDRDYELFAFDPATVVSVRAGPFAAGVRDARVEVPDGLAHPRVAGRLVSRRGRPVPGARVMASRTVHRTEWGSSWMSGTEVETDADGRFELTEVPRDGYLHVGGEGVVPEDFPLEEGRDPEQLELEIGLRCHFQVTVEGSDLADLGIEVLDATGQALSIYTFSAQGSSSRGMLPLLEGRMEISAVSEEGIEVRLHRLLEKGERRELARRPLALVPEDVCEVRFALE